jgi:hypothetical protein
LYFVPLQRARVTIRHRRLRRVIGASSLLRANLKANGRPHEFVALFVRCIRVPQG